MIPSVMLIVPAATARLEQMIETSRLSRRLMARTLHRIVEKSRELSTGTQPDDGAIAAEKWRGLSTIYEGREPMRRAPMVLIGVLVVAGIAAALSNGESAVSSDDDLAQAMCADLRDGFSLFQMHSQAVEHYRNLGRSEDAAQSAAAHLEDDATREHCPQFRDEFEATFAYEQWIAP